MVIMSFYLPLVHSINLRNSWCRPGRTGLVWTAIEQVRRLIYIVYLARFDWLKGNNCTIMHNLHGSNLLPLIIFHYTLLHLITLVFCSLVYKIHHSCNLGLQIKKKKNIKRKNPIDPTLDWMLRCFLSVKFNNLSDVKWKSILKITGIKYQHRTLSRLQNI